MKIGILGGGAVGSQAALICAKILPDAKITVLDNKSKLSNLRTFVFLAGTYHRLLDLGLWDNYKSVAHAIVEVDSSFKGSFGGLSFSANDCASDIIAYSFAEGQLINQLRKELINVSNIKYIDNANITKIAKDRTVEFQINNKEQSLQFDLIAIAGLATKLIKDIGFSYKVNTYAQKVFVSAIEDANPSNTTYERIYQTGTVTLIPRKDGYGHVMVTNNKDAEILSKLNKEEYQEYLINNNLHISKSINKLLDVRSYQPQLKVAKQSGINNICLLGASACNVHPIGAQELNLGIKDAFVLANLIKETKLKQDIGEEFHLARLAERNKVIRFTDTVAKLVAVDSCVKHKLTGLLATGINILPIARRNLLKNIILN